MEEYLKGRGAQYNPSNRFQKNSVVQAHMEGLDAPLLSNDITEFINENPKKIVNKVSSPDIPFVYSVNPYQGCEHGCIYCYARSTHQYWGYSAGLDFERRIIVKENAPGLLEKTIRGKNWKVEPIMFSGNTDCYQPIERKLELTRKCLQILWEYRHPVGMITKNSLIQRDIDILQKMASRNLVKVSISVTTLDEALRRKMEPRTATGKQRIQTIARLSEAGIPVNVMIGPIIPGLNNHELVDILRAAADAGARTAFFTMVRLNGPIADIFVDWVEKAYPDRAAKVLGQIAAMHGGQLGSSRFGSRMRGEGNQAQAIRDLFRVTRDKLFAGRSVPEYNLHDFSVPDRGSQLQLFG